MSKVAKQEVKVERCKSLYEVPKGDTHRCDLNEGHKENHISVLEPSEDITKQPHPKAIYWQTSAQTGVAQ